MNVAVIGASKKPERYSYKAIHELKANGHTPFPVHPALTEVQGIKVYKSALDIPKQIDTVSLYINADRSSQLQNEILKLNPRRIIFNPGAENNSLRDAAQDQGIETMYACTLVLLATGQF